MTDDDLSRLRPGQEVYLVEPVSGSVDLVTHAWVPPSPDALPEVHVLRVDERRASETLFLDAKVEGPRRIVDGTITAGRLARTRVEAAEIYLKCKRDFLSQARDRDRADREIRAAERLLGEERAR